MESYVREGKAKTSKLGQVNESTSQAISNVE